MKQVVLLALLGIFVLSCDKDHDCEDPMEKKCDGYPITDSLRISTLIVGSWSWTELTCYCCPGVQSGAPDKDVTATFKSDGTYFVILEDEIISLGDWELVETGMGYEFLFNNNNQEIVGYLDGSIAMCESQFTADLLPVDGCRHTFTRAD